jgi:hypothetical protein
MVATLINPRSVKKLTPVPFAVPAREFPVLLKFPRDEVDGLCEAVREHAEDAPRSMDEAPKDQYYLAGALKKEPELAGGPLILDLTK